MPAHHDSCPLCGHDLSAFREDPPDRGERVAMSFAEAVASWRFPGVLLVAIATWLAINIAARPFEPHPMVMLGTIAAVLATVAACDGPLILLTQRRAAARDRARSREVYQVVARSEADLHRLASRLDELTASLDAQSSTAAHDNSATRRDA